MNTQDFKVNSRESDEYEPLPQKPEPITALESDEYDIPKQESDFPYGKRVVFKRNKFSKEEVEVLLTALAKPLVLCTLINPDNPTLFSIST